MSWVIRVMTCVRDDVDSFNPRPVPLFTVGAAPCGRPVFPYDIDLIRAGTGACPYRLRLYPYMLRIMPMRPNQFLLRPDLRQTMLDLSRISLHLLPLRLETEQMRPDPSMIEPDLEQIEINPP